jgi:hypothetical protein
MRPYHTDWERAADILVAPGECAGAAGRSSAPGSVSR